MTDKEKGKEIVTVEFIRHNNFETSKTTREFPRSTAEKGIKSKAGAWKHARIITKAVEVDLGIPKKEPKANSDAEIFMSGKEEQVKEKQKPGPKAKKSEDADEIKE